MSTDLFKIDLKKNPCIENLSEDDVRKLVKELSVVVQDKNFNGFVTVGNSTKNRSRAHFGYTGDGNFAGVFAKVNSQSMTILHGVQGKSRTLFEGAPSSSNPGPGWTVDETASKRFLNQTGAQDTWDYFFAYPTGIINTF